tara:strand:- start:1148 stop:1357 length:210 start_codon:yes stop_codon:yes gene_type:complete
MKVTKARSLAKAVMYRGLGTASTFLIAWAFTGEAMIATGIAILEFFVKTALYYFYERFWNLISWGRSKS